jgi:hypothetical protein
MARFFRLEMSDGDWDIPLDFIARHQAKWYSEVWGHSFDELLTKFIHQFNEDPDDAKDWAQWNMNWADFDGVAVRVSGPRPVNYQAEFVDCEYKLIDK